MIWHDISAAQMVAAAAPRLASRPSLNETVEYHGHERGKRMKYMEVWSVEPEHYGDAIERWKKARAETKAPGTETLGIWFEVGTGKGYTLIETDDPLALSRRLHRWSDLIDQKIVPVVDGEEMAKALEG
jgi:hypothetical protein